MSNFRLFMIAVALAFWPALFFARDRMEEFALRGPGQVSATLLLMTLLIIWFASAVVALFGDRRR